MVAFSIPAMYSQEIICVYIWYVSKYKAVATKGGHTRRNFIELNMLHSTNLNRVCPPLVERKICQVNVCYCMLCVYRRLSCQVVHTMWWICWQSEEEDTDMAITEYHPHSLSCKLLFTFYTSFTPRHMYIPHFSRTHIHTHTHSTFFET